MDQVKILWIDDDKFIQDLGKSMVKMAGYEGIFSDNGTEGLEKIFEVKPDLVIIDYMLPELSGEEILTRLYNAGFDNPIIMLTGEKIEKQKREDMMKMGLNALLEKPFGIKELLIVIDNVLSNHSVKKQIKTEAERWYEASVIDRLSKLYNYLHFEFKLNDEIIRARRQGYSLSLIKMDIDNFKLCNAKYGFKEGDLVIQKVGQLIKANIRTNVDSGFRCTDDEFAVLLLGAKEEEATSIARRIQYDFEKMNLCGATLSFGISTLTSDVNIMKFIERADKAMYVAKKLGKNRIQVYSMIKNNHKDIFAQMESNGNGMSVIL
jgi:diguanylate cyclase (GGDEF)-like protein